MNRTIRYDEETRELRLVLTDYWKGEHEHMEYRVVDDEGVPLRGSRHEHWHGRQVYWDGERYYVKPDGLYSARVVSFTTEQRPVVANKVACPRYTNRRRRCDACRAMEARS